MKLRFSFFTARPVPLYAGLCNQFLQHPLVKAIGANGDGYFLEAEGEQQDELATLADLIGRTFPISCWLTKTDTQGVEEFVGEAQMLEQPKSIHPYCRHCRDNIGEDCRHCGAPSESEALGESSLTDWIAELTASLLETGQAQFQSRSGLRTLFLPKSAPANADQLLFCNPEKLNQALHIGDRGILTLSSLEKPRLRLVPREAFALEQGLKHNFYYCQLADDRLTLALTEHLAKQGIDVVLFESATQGMAITYWDESPVLLANGPKPLKVLTKEPKRDGIHVEGFLAKWDGKSVSLMPKPAADSIKPELAAFCALEAERQQGRTERNSAVLYLSNKHRSGLAYKDPEGEYKWLVQLPETEQNTTSIIEAIDSTDTGKRLLAQYEEKQPEVLERLKSLSHHSFTGSLADTMAAAAWFTGLDNGDDKQQASEKLMAASIAHDFPVAPRIDFKLNRDAEVLTLEWTKAFQACLSYRMADPDNMAAVAFGVIDSFCDFVGNWVEQLDADIGLDEVILAGDEFENPLLLDRMRLRLGKNINLRLPDPLDLAGNNLVLGALFLDADPVVSGS